MCCRVKVNVVVVVVVVMMDDGCVKKNVERV